MIRRSQGFYRLSTEGNEHRYETMRRVRLWRFVSGQPDYDFGERFLRRIEYLPTQEGKEEALATS